MDESTQTMETQAPTSVPGPTTMPDYSVGATNNNKKVAAIVGIVVIVLILAGVGVWAWFTFGMAKTPEQVFAKMMEQSKAINSVAFDTTIKADSADLADPTKQDVLTVTIHGSHQGMSLPTAKGLLNVDVSLASADTTPVEGAFELRLADNIAYGQVTKLPDLGVLLFGAPAGSTTDTTNQILNKWAALDFNVLKQYLEDAKNQPEITASEKTRIDAAITLLTGAQSNNTQRAQEVMELAKKHNLIQLKNVLVSDTIDGQEMYHYELGVNKENVFPFWKDVMTLFAPDVYGSMTPEELTQAETDTNDTLKKVQIGGEVWIGKNDFYLHKITIAVTPDSATAEVNNTGENVVNPAVTMEINFKDYNKAVEVTKPEGAYPALDALQSLDQFQESLMGPIQPTEPTITDTERDTDTDGIPDFMEVQFYQSDPNNPDTDGDGFKDGEEVKNGYNPAGPGKLNQ